MRNTLFLFFAAIVLLSCGGKKADRRVITVSIEPLRFFAEQIAGDKAVVETLVPSGSSPETYEPTAQQMVALSNSMMFVKVGDLGFEHMLTDKINGLTDNIAIVNSSEGINAVVNSSRGVTDQHTWMSCANAIVIAGNVCKALKEADPDNASFYDKRYEGLRESIVELDAELKGKLKPVEGSSFIIYHPALTYFAHEYGLNQIAVEEDGREPSAASLAKVIDQAKARNVRLMLVQQEFDRRNAEIVAKALGIGMTTVNPLSYNWDKEMRNIGNIIAAQGNASPSTK